MLAWDDLRFVLAVARSGGLTPAAAGLATSASTVSRHIDAMEAALGVRLFLRQQRGYLLTDAGSALYEQVAEVERAMQAVELVRPGTLDPDPIRTRAVAAACHQAGVLVLTAGTYGNVLRFLPPLVMPEALLEEAFGVITEAFAATPA